MVARLVRKRTADRILAPGPARVPQDCQAVLFLRRLVYVKAPAVLVHLCATLIGMGLVEFDWLDTAEYFAGQAN
eukprot:12747878-Alexandrium_andersonii.AAC.1